jgi:uncharacterized surface protein with fasciclin (FAS1) repeats
MLLRIKKSLSRIITVLVFTGLILTPVAVNSAAPSNSNSLNIIGVATNSTDFTTLVTAVKAAGLAETLSGTGPFTVLAPNNNAFNKLPFGLLEKLVMPENKATLVKILTYHVISGKNDAASITKFDGQSLPTVNGNSIKVKIANGAVTLNTSVNVIKTDVTASNGIIHIIDQVLVPADLDLSKLVSKTNSASSIDNTVRSGGLSLHYYIAVITFLIFGLITLFRNVFYHNKLRFMGQ